MAWFTVSECRPQPVPRPRVWGCDWMYAHLCQPGLPRASVIESGSWTLGAALSYKVGFFLFIFTDKQSWGS